MTPSATAVTQACNEVHPVAASPGANSRAAQAEPSPQALWGPPVKYQGTPRLEGQLHDWLAQVGGHQRFDGPCERIAEKRGVGRRKALRVTACCQAS
ncbi:MAG TPA: hypothetical protein G4O04_04545 [Anaerolineae bacterium]|nr:hypothetical protein [Anaerolineae bacterium]HID85538.1 hypothetical protein [Anaerolineales bacterium]